MSTRKLIGKVSATEKNPSSCDEFQFWLSDDTILSPFDIVLVHNKTDDSITYGVVQDIFHITDGAGHISNYVSSDFGNVDIAPMTRRLSLSYAKVSVIHNTKENFMPVFEGSAVYTADEDDNMTQLARLAIRPLRIAFDDIKLKDKYCAAVRTAHKHGIKEISNYILFNYKDTILKRMEQLHSGRNYIGR